MQNGRRPRLGLIVQGIDYAYQESLLRGADEECRSEDADLICFAGADFATGQLPDATYDVIEEAALDGLLIVTSTMGAAIGSRQFSAFLARFKHIPVCSLGYEMEGMLNVIVDGSSTVERLTQHLAEEHGRRRFAFLEGNNTESIERLAAFHRGLANAGLEADPRLIFQGRYRADGGQEAVERMRAMPRQTSLGESAFPVDAIVAANDWMALGALRALEAAGLRVPEDVSVVGFDDIDQARFEMPSLTTIRQPAEQLGAAGVRALLDACRGNAPAAVTRLPTELRLRKSCGCFSGAQLNHSLRVPSVQPSPESGGKRLQELVHQLDNAAPGFKNFLAAEWSLKLVEAFDADVDSAVSDEFTKTLESFIRATAKLGNVAAWHHVVSTLRKHAIRRDASVEQLRRAADLFDAAQILVSAHAERVQGARRLDKESLLRALTQLSEDLRTASSYAEISSVLARQLPKLNVPGCLITAHEGKLSPETQSDVVTAYDASRGVLAFEGHLRAGELIPAAFAPARRTTWIATVATFKREVLGFCMLEVSSVETSRYISICEQVGVSLNAVRLLRAMVEEVTRRERAERERLESEIALATRIQTGILPRAQLVPGLSIASAMHPATEVGGDYFDVLPVQVGAWFAIGDVAGHGLPAGLVMLMIQSIVAAITAVEPDAKPSEIWVQLNRVLYENVRLRLQQDEHATLTLLRYAGDGEFEFAGAHEDIIVHRAATGQVETVATPGIWAGIMANPPPGAVSNSRLTLSPGDTLILCTDGVFEARNAGGELFGIERVCEEFARLSPLSVDGIVDELMRVVHAWTHEQLDDITAVVIRYVGA